ncbi:hypothetical protein jhhlp_006984 [Lomentospora prolificans]|uniref:Uncharacterized protein n=1 Tax=Lomentospora prolificans TaxID=41688 RepID=A0A2N3N1C7_9PEZI|nr:hypothetical protein jhhlp_006984 [Lomentospora prolificans]
MSGLVYLGLGVALVAAMGAFGALGERAEKWAQLKAGGQKEASPERRWILMVYFSPMVRVGLFVYSWTVLHKVHWIVPIISTTFIGFGAFFVIEQLYLVDRFGSEGAASALGANNLLRFISSTFLPHAGPSM